jgi:Cof subfamily protein (haloacid dehalogenase superfamily)
MPVRLIAIDIDGTLLDSDGEIPHDNRVAIAAALARGIEVALVTGRAFHFARPIAARLGLPVLFMVSNGALIKTMDGERLLARLMPAEVARGLLERTSDYRPDAAVIFDRPAEGQVVAGGMDWQHPSRVGYWARNMAIIDEVVPLEACLVEDPIQVMFNGGVERMRTLASQLDGAGEAHDYSVTITEYAERDFTLVDVLAAGVSKGTTVGIWARERGYTPDEVMAIGDNYNDVAMLEYAGVPVVMGNAVPELLGSGYPVTATNDEAGLARAIERYALAPLGSAPSPEPPLPPTP